MIRVVALILSIIVVSTAEAQDRFITLSSTTSTQDSGLFGYILPLFTAETGVAVHVVAVGTGQALAIGRRGDADALLVHDHIGENNFVADGYGIDRRHVMYNDFSSLVRLRRFPPCPLLRRCVASISSFRLRS